MDTVVVPLKPNHRTYERQRHARELEKERLIQKIGIDPDDAPLFDEELRFLAYQESLNIPEVL